MSDHVILDAISQMLAAPDPVGRLQIVVSAMRKLGWRRVSLALYDDVVKVMTATDAGLLFSSKVDAQLWGLNEETLPLESRIGMAYFVRANASAAMGWQTGDAVIIPLRLNDKRLAGMFRLEEPIDHALPTPESLRPVEILTAQTIFTLESSRLLDDLQKAKDALTNQVEELTMLQSVDQELNASLNLDNVMMLTTDWALRRTGARAGTLAVTNADGDALIPLVLLGYPASQVTFSADNPISLSLGIIGRVARTRQMAVVRDVTQDPDYYPIVPGMKTQIVAPLEMQGRLLGIISLESDRPERFSEADIEFVKRLAARASVALDNARLYREAERRADEMAALYSAGRSISSSLERDQIVPHISQSVAVMLDTSGSLVTDCRLDRMTATILSTYRLGTLTQSLEHLPAVGDSWNLKEMPGIAGALSRHTTLELRRADPSLAEWARRLMETINVQVMVMSPLVVQNEVLGMVIALESRRDRHFSQDDLLLLESLASQAAVAFRQANLFEEVRELENLKSEMIRMASHDLRNPLGNVIGYLDVLTTSLRDKATDVQREYMAHMRTSAYSMRSLIEDLLSLEKVESERQQSWTQLDLAQLVQEVVTAQRATAELKGHTLTLERDDGPLRVFGSPTQLRQAITNLVGNSLKYTANNGKVQVRLHRKGDQAQFEVEDNGYGIAPERQQRLFQRFYRAKQPGTEGIPGTGLGLSLVKTVINRHGGEVWVKSEEEKGSIFGFWLPEATAALEAVQAVKPTGNT